MPTGWVGSNRRQSLPPDWPQTVLRILRRDHHRCQWVRHDTERRCLAKAHDVDHITPHSQGGTDHDSNLMALCTFHHRKKTGIEGGTASGKAKRARAEAEKPIHPGLLPVDPLRRAYRPERDGPAPF